jgi:tripartite-type tricarboxylate transporter receptor subunit TctC
MKLSRRTVLRLAASVAALPPALSRLACAQAYPTHPITMIVPYPAGGPTDTVGRVVAEHMRKELGQPVILENVTGAAGSIGLGRVARAPADGYTINVGNWGAHVVNGAIYTLPYDLKTDFASIALLAQAPQIVVARKDFPANDLRGLVAWLKANPGKATIGTAGVGSPPHIAAVFLLNLTGARAQIVSYRGMAPAMQDLVAGQIDFMIDTAANSLPQVRAGTIKAFAVTSKTRLSAAPDIPTVDEAGLPGLYALNWQAAFLPKGAPKDVVAKLNAAVMSALADASVQKRLAGIGQEIFPPAQQTAEALAAFQKSEVEKWWPLIKAANIKAE